MKNKKGNKTRIALNITAVIFAVSIIVTVGWRIISTRFAVEKTPDTGKDYVILLHGIGGFSYSMLPLQHELEKQGYTVVNINYPSTKYDIPTISERFLDSVLVECCPDKSRKVHFVTHSMGSQVTRYYLKRHSDNINVGRVVMLAPPNKGSELADYFKPNPLVKEVFGPALDDLGTDSASLVNELGPVTYETGVIIGNKPGIIPGTFLIPGEDDGVVSVKSAVVDGMKEFKVTGEPHTMIMMKKKIIANVVSFINYGKFKTS